MKSNLKQFPKWLKQIIKFSGILLILAGIPIGIGMLCFGLEFLIYGENDAGPGIFILTLLALTLGVGRIAFSHASASLKNEPSKPMRIPVPWKLIGVFGFLIVFGSLVSDGKAAGFFIPPTLLAAAALPSLWAVSRFQRRDDENFTIRRGMVAYAGGATINVFIAILLEILFPAIILSLVLGLAEPVLDNLESLLDALAGNDVADAITSRGFIYTFVQIAIIAPLAEEIAKPLITLPVIGRLSKRGAFLVGAMAGAGFAALENVLYAGFGLSIWVGIMALRAVGGAIHPLGSGLVALGWHGVLNREPDGWKHLLKNFGIAVGIHALWNGGSLLVFTLAGARFFGELPPEIDVLGLSAAGTTLAFLVILGLATIWLGSSIDFGPEKPLPLGSDPSSEPFTISDRTLAIWALACLAAFVPAGIAGLQLILR